MSEQIETPNAERMGFGKPRPADKLFLRTLKGSFATYGGWVLQRR
jgi:hypothetical protein